MSLSIKLVIVLNVKSIYTLNYKRLCPTVCVSMTYPDDLSAVTALNI